MLVDATRDVGAVTKDLNSKESCGVAGLLAAAGFLVGFFATAGFLVGFFATAGFFAAGFFAAGFFAAGFAAGFFAAAALVGCLRRGVLGGISGSPDDDPR